MKQFNIIKSYLKSNMESNRHVITKMIEEYGVEASPEAKEALINFSVLYG